MAQHAVFVCGRRLGVTISAGLRASRASPAQAGEQHAAALNNHTPIIDGAADLISG